MRRLLLILFLLGCIFTPIVSADVSCSFINITTGPTGATGATGANGTSCNLTVNATFLLAAGSAATVTNIGTETNVELDFGIPAGEKGDTGDIPDVSDFLFLNGTRAMTGNLSMASQYINNLFSGDLPSDAVNKSYVDDQVAGMSNYNATYDAKPDSTYNATYDAYTNYNTSYNNLIRTDYVYTGNGSYILGTNTSYFLVDGSRAMTGNISMGTNYINDLVDPSQDQDAATKKYVDDNAGSNYNATYDAKPDSTYNTSYNDLIRTDYVYTGNGSYLLGSNTSIATVTYVGEVNTSMKNYVDDQVSGVSNYNASYVEHSNTSYVLTNNASYILGTNTSYVLTGNASIITSSNTSYLLVDGSRAMTGNLSLGSKYINDLLSGGIGTAAVNKSYVDAADALAITTSNTSYVLTNNGSYILGTNTSYVLTNNASIVTTSNTSYVLTNNATYVLTNNASYVLGSNTTHVTNPVYGYVTLMSGNAMVTTTNPTVMNQWETSTNKNNYITLNFTDTGSEVGQWIVDFPADWNSSANVVFTPIWTAPAGSGTVYWQIKGKLFPDDAAIDTALANISSSTDTLIATGDMHVAPDTTGAAITSVSSGGNTAIIQASRDSTQDSLSGTAQLIGLRVKYVRNFG